MKKNVWSRILLVLICVTIGACKTTSIVSVSDNVRRVITYDSNKKISVTNEEIELADPINIGQWWKAKKSLQGVYTFTAKGISDRQAYEDDLSAMDAAGSVSGGY
jgi:hypothetical protein